MESKRRAELLAVRVRWAVLAAACVMLEGRANLLVIGLVGAGVVAYNLILRHFCRNLEDFHVRGQKMAILARWLDIGVVTLTLFANDGTSSSTYLLYLVVLVQAGFADSRRKVLLAMTVVAAGAYLIATILQKSGAAFNLYTFGRAGLISVGGLVAFYIGATRRQDDTGRYREQRLTSLFDCSIRSVSGESLNKVLTHILRTAVQETNAMSGYIMLAARDDSQLLETEVAYSREVSYEFPRSARFGDGLPGYVAAHGQPVMLNAGEHASAPWDAEANVCWTTSAICVPLVNRLAAIDPATKKHQEMIGCIAVLSVDPKHSFTEEDLDFVRMLAALVSLSSANERMYEDMRNTFVRTLETLATSLEARDEYTRGHSQRVCDLSLMIAKEMGVCEEALEEMRVGTLLHDIGKIGIPDSVLNKPGRLTTEEFQQMKQHPGIGWEICKPLGLNEGALMLVRNHHEKLDGSGYPDGLRGGELPLSVRIVCVADAFDAMSSRRPYRDVMDEKLRLEQFNRFAGSQFDPVVVQVLKNLLRDGRLDEMYKDHWFDVKAATDRAKAA